MGKKKVPRIVYEYDIGYIVGQLRALQEELARVKIQIEELTKNERKIKQ